MKTKTSILLGTFLIHLSILCKVYAQDPHSQGQNIGTYDDLFRGYMQLQYNEGITEFEYEGSPFITSTDSTGKFHFDNVEITNQQLRYNIYNDAMELYKDGQFHRIKKTEICTDFIINEHLFKFVNNFENEKLQSLYLEVVLTTQNISFYKKHRVIFIKPESAKPFQEARPAKFKTINPRYYISINNHNLTSFNSNKELLNLFPEIQSELKSNIKKNKLKYRNEDDLVEILTFANSLMK